MKARIELTRLRINGYQSEEELYKKNTDKLGRSFDLRVINSKL